MPRRRVQPVPAELPLRLLRAVLRPGQVVGVWTGGHRSGRPLLHRSSALFISTDLGLLLARAERVIAWDGSRLRTLPLGARQAG